MAACALVLLTMSAHAAVQPGSFSQSHDDAGGRMCYLTRPTVTGMFIINLRTVQYIQNRPDGSRTVVEFHMGYNSSATISYETPQQAEAATREVIAKIKTCGGNVE